MKARRLARVRRKDALYRAIQRTRLDRIADGEIEPRFDHEHYFLWTVRAGRRARYADFILPGLLFAAETEAAKMAEAAAPAPADAALTAS